MKETNFLDYTHPYEERYNALKNIISKSEKIVFFTGAGVSTGSGIPDFRSEDGLYNNMPEEYHKFKPEYLLSADCINHRPKVFFEFYKRIMDVRKYEPNSVHKTMALLEKEGKSLGVITQNIDMLHQKAGSTNVAELHGTLATSHCVKCKRVFDKDFIFESTSLIPRCPDCEAKNKSSAFVRPNIVLYGEKLPTSELNKAYEMISNADCLIVCGTSLLVTPASTFVSEYVGKNLIIINREETPYSKYADVEFREDMNVLFERLYNDLTK